jgi:hypothetical protein
MRDRSCDHDDRREGEFEAVGATADSAAPALVDGGLNAGDPLQLRSHDVAESINPSETTERHD